MADNRPDIDSVVPVEALSEQWQKPEAYQGITLILKAATFQQGKRGQYYVLTCEVEETNQTILISTGAGQPRMVVQAWLEAGSRPVRFAFTIDGNRTLISKPLDSGQLPAF